MGVTKVADERIVTRKSLEREEASIYDTGSERALLACIMQDGKLMYEAFPVVKLSDIYNPYNRKIYEIMRFLFTSQAKTGQEASYDVMSMLSVAKKLHREESFLENTGGMEHLKAIENAPVKTDAFQNYIQNILSTSYKVQMYRKGRDVQLEALSNRTNDIGEFVSTVEEKILSVSANRKDDSIVRIGENAVGFIEKCEKNKGKDVLRVTINFAPKLMEVLQCIKRKQLFILFARPKVGKSAFFVNIAIDVACLQGIPVFYMDTEMSEDEQLSRTISRWSGVDEWDIIDGTFADNPKHKQAVYEIASLLSQSPFYYSAARGVGKEELVSRIRQFKTKYVGTEEVDGEIRTKPCLVIYDWLKVADAESMRGLKEYQELGFLATAMKDVSAELDIPIVAGAQANRMAKMEGVDGTSSEYAEAFLADSDKILRFCTCLMWLRKVTRNEDLLIQQVGPDNYYNQVLHVVSNRLGPTCNEGIPFHYSAKTISYEESNVDMNIFEAIGNGSLPESDEQEEKNVKEKEKENDRW